MFARRPFFYCGLPVPQINIQLFAALKLPPKTAWAFLTHKPSLTSWLIADDRL